MKNQYLECGKIINTHGIAGGLKAESWCDSAAVLAGLSRVYWKDEEGLHALKVLKASVFREFVIFSFEHIDDIDTAEKFRGKVLLADRDDLKIGEGSFFVADLIGLSVLDADSGKKYGVMKDVIRLGGSELYVVDTPAGERMIPNVPQFIAYTDLDRGIFVTPIPGLLEDA